ncbi:uncharacterized protein EV420DRAFT_1510562 [Desarmillaria tabescens]|uniref:C2H2-type domain-containing protein n=1 Tax=Armillaria tabescens TaxID=1929756 RepID=A0AA39NIE5_ARMTA|nr:uncharacterized protein EV420DRAFT_1510562 [Desarmillaria tabescens]KAK0466205.1 hypothetical protein EV420DRAFT_1510562 [Desarmillaria tabescens]
MAVLRSLKIHPSTQSTTYRHLTKHPTSTMIQHNSTPGSWLCRSCDMCFTDKYSLFEHNQSSRHFVCGDSRCKGRAFRSALGLREHLRQAAVHREYDHAQCKRCDRQFTSTHCVLLHLDMGGCRSVNWEWVLKRVKRRDRRNIYVDPDVDFEAASCSGTGTYCTTCRRPFKNPFALKQHLTSPAHQPRVLKCPVAGCGSRFATLSALAQHIETGTKCAKRDNKALREWKKFVGKIGLVAKVTPARPSTL